MLLLHTYVRMYSYRQSYDDIIRSSESGYCRCRCQEVIFIHSPKTYV